MKKIFLILLPFTLLSCIISTDNKCTENDLTFLSKHNYYSITNTCDYMDELEKSMYSYGTLYVPTFYELSKVSTELGIDFINHLKEKYLSLNIGEVDKVKMYYIFKNLYQYDDDYIENEVGIKIDEKYKNYNLSLHRLILAENLLCWGDYEESHGNYYEVIGDKYIVNKNRILTGFILNEDGKITNYITNDEIKYLTDMFELDINVYGGFWIVSSDREIFESLDNEGKELYIKMLEVIIKNTTDSQTLDYLSDYLIDFKKEMGIECLDIELGAIDKLDVLTLLNTCNYNEKLKEQIYDNNTLFYKCFQ